MRPSRNRHQLRAHPRSRGENRTGGQRTHLWDGSSPLTRGKLTHAVSERETEGLIPAHAGKTDRARRWVAAHRAHPRSRGENPKPVAPPEPGWGSSPLTRGKHVAVRVLLRPDGLIPAHAGKTPYRQLRGGTSWAHPRSRGENLRGAHVRLGMSGSSPLTRGKPSETARQGIRRRLIPAHAGKTPSRSPRLNPAGAHPRSRGENGEAKVQDSLVEGSSPLTRGKRSVRHV